MSSPKKKKRLDRQKVKSFLARHYRTQKEFCAEYDINHQDTSD